MGDALLIASTIRRCSPQVNGRWHVTTTTSAGGRAPRADAQRNRDHILEVAEKHFSEHGVTGSLDGIAKRAGIGPGTLYRHFPNREALLAALLASRQSQLAERTDAIRSQSPDAATALNEWIVALVEWASAFDGLPEPLRAALSSEASPLTLTCRGYITITDEFLARAQDEGTARRDVGGRELFLTALAISWARSALLADENSAAAMTELARSGWARTTPPGGPR
jgi:AcrR family transcriptional regulator